MLFSVTLTEKAIDEDGELSRDVENESPQLHESDVGEVRTLVIDISALVTQVGKYNSIEQIEEGLQTSVQEVVRAHGHGEASYGMRRHFQTSLSLPPRENERENIFHEEVNDESEAER